MIQIYYTIAFYLLYLFWGRNGLTQCSGKGEATGNDLLLVLKGLSFLVTRSQSLDTGFQIQEENNHLEIPLICFLAPLSNDFKVLCFNDKIAALTAAEKVRKENYFNTFGVWVYRTLCVLISFNF